MRLRPKAHRQYEWIKVSLLFDGFKVSGSARGYSDYRYGRPEHYFMLPIIVDLTQAR
jgi:hypothetical protein